MIDILLDFIFFWVLFGDVVLFLLDNPILFLIDSRIVNILDHWIDPDIGFAFIYYVILLVLVLPQDIIVAILTLPITIFL